MALRSKDSTLQLRLESELLQRFKEMCEEEGRPVSWVLRDYMRSRVDQWERRKGRRVEPPAAPAAAAAALAAARARGSMDDDDDDEPEQEMSRQQRRQLEREMRKRGR